MKQIQTDEVWNAMEWEAIEKSRASMKKRLKRELIEIVVISIVFCGFFIGILYIANDGKEAGLIEKWPLMVMFAMAILGLIFAHELIGNIALQRAIKTQIPEKSVITEVESRRGIKNTTSYYAHFTYKGKDATTRISWPEFRTGMPIYVWNANIGQHRILEVDEREETEQGTGRKCNGKKKNKKKRKKKHIKH